MAAADKLVFLLDCDNTLLDNDRVIDDLPDYDFSALTSPAGSVDGRQETT